MRFNKILSAAALAVFVGFGSAQEASATDFLLPDLTFTARQDGRTGESGVNVDNCPVMFNGDSFSMFVSAGVGDLTALNTGSGFQLTNSTILHIASDGAVTENGFRYNTSINLTINPGVTVSLSSAPGVGTPLRVERTLNGYDAFGIMEVVAATEGSPWNIGDQLALDLHLQNVHQIVVNGETFWCAGIVKGDLAPPIPEPGTLGLVFAGLASAVVRRRKKA